MIDTIKYIKQDTWVVIILLAIILCPAHNGQTKTGAE
jgi:hypothetical protein